MTDCLNPLNYLAIGQAYKNLKRTKRAGGCSFNSFTAETPVHTIDADGNPALKAISELKVGDKVLAKSEWKAKGEDGDALTVQIEDIRAETKVLTTYNLEVAFATAYRSGTKELIIFNNLEQAYFTDFFP